MHTEGSDSSFRSISSHSILQFFTKMNQKVNLKKWPCIHTSWKVYVWANVKMNRFYPSFVSFFIICLISSHKHWPVSITNSFFFIAAPCYNRAALQSFFFCMSVSPKFVWEKHAITLNISVMQKEWDLIFHLVAWREMSNVLDWDCGFNH